MPIDVDAARTFVQAHGRLLDQHAFRALFDGGDPQTVVRALAAYQNTDGGFGHGLEPDTRCPHSQPLDVEIALEYLVTVGAAPPAEFVRAFDFLTDVSDADGAVPVLLPSIAGHPRAAHWVHTDEYPPDLNPTAAIAGYGHELGIDHPWIHRATDHTVRVLEAGALPDGAHALLCATRFLDRLSDRGLADTLARRVAEALPGTSLFQARPDPTSYGLGPLDFAPAPTSLAAAWFDDDLVGENLDHLESQQQADGGWPVTWEPPSEASRCEWRAIRTIQALRTLEAHRRIRP